MTPKRLRWIQDWIRTIERAGDRDSPLLQRLRRAEQYLVRRMMR